MLRLYDTLSGTQRTFQPAGPLVKMYVCGVTPYDTTHLGHAFTFVSFDVLLRYLRYLGLRVQYVQNVTDVDDPLFDKARALDIPYAELASEQTERYLADMRALNVLPPDHFPRASGEIPEMIELVEALLEQGHAYQVDGWVYFSVATDPDYGKLSKLDRAQMIELARERGGNPDDPRKRDQLDFVLWRPSGPEEPGTPSPWGEGLPGWHVECSAMSLKYLDGLPLDIHGGGSDLIFPHHESEIAQSEAATGTTPLARFWCHTGMVYMDGEKMSKSLGNMVFVRDLIREHNSDALRLYLSSCHYRSSLEYDPGQLAEADRLATALTEAASLPAGSSRHIDVAGHRERFLDRMNDDLDTPGAIAVLRDLGETIEKEAAGGREVRPLQGLLGELGNVLGLRLSQSAETGSQDTRYRTDVAAARTRRSSP